MGRGLLALTLVACSGPLALERVAARGVLAYGVATAGGRVASVELDGEFALVVRGADVRRVRLGPPDWDFVGLAAAGEALAVACLDGTVRLHDAGSGAETARWRLDAAATAVALSPDGRLLATGAASGVLCLRRTADGALLQCVVAHGARVAALAFGDGQLASGGCDGSVSVWSVLALARRDRWDGPGAVNAVALSTGGAVAVARSGAPPTLSPAGVPRASPIDAVEVRRGDQVVRLTGHTAAPVAVAWIDERRLVSAGWDRTVRLWDGGVEIGRLEAFSGVVRALAPAPGGVWVAAWTAPDGNGPAVAWVAVR